MSRVALIIILTCNVIFMCQTGLVVAQTNECNVNADCNNPFKVCCGSGRSKSCQFFSCLNRKCITDGDCGGKGECCSKSHQCVTSGCQECFSDFACAFREYCCKQRYINDHNVCRRSCVGETCHSSSDCAVGECCISNKCVTNGCAECTSNSHCPTSQYCCTRGSLSNVCRESCVGETCLLNSDCGGPGEFCSSNQCTKSVNSSTLAGWVIGIIVGGAILLVTIIGVVCLCRRCNKPSKPGVVLQQPSQGTSATIALEHTQVHTNPTLEYPEPSAPPYLPEPTAPLQVLQSQVQDILSQTATLSQGLNNLPKPTAPPFVLETTATPHLSQPLQVLNRPRITQSNPGQNFVRSQLQDALSQGLENTLSETLDFTSLPSLDVTGLGELNLDFGM